MFLYIIFYVGTIPVDMENITRNLVMDISIVFLGGGSYIFCISHFHFIHPQFQLVLPQFSTFHLLCYLCLISQKCIKN